MISITQAFLIAVLSCIIVFALGSYARQLVARRRQRKAQAHHALQAHLRTIHAKERVKQQLLEALLDEVPDE